MEIIRQWAVSICFAAVVCAVVMMIVPPGSTEKVFRITVSAFFICCAVLPIINNFSDINLELNQSFEQNEDIAIDITQKMDEQIIREIELQLSKSAQEIFNMYNCDAKDVYKRQPQQGACKLTLNVKNGIIQEALVETLGCSGMTHSAAMAAEILMNKTLLEALNTDLVCDAINVAMREIFKQLVYGRSPTAFSEDGDVYKRQV